MPASIPMPIATAIFKAMGALRNVRYRAAFLATSCLPLYSSNAMNANTEVRLRGGNVLIRRPYNRE